MGKIIRISLFFISVLAIISCGNYEDSSSTKSDIYVDKHECRVNQKKFLEYKEKYSKYFSGASTRNSIDKNLMELSTMPRAYMEYVFDKHHTKVVLNPSRCCYSHRISKKGIYHPTKIETSFTWMRHEFSHALQGYFQEKYPEFDKALSEAQKKSRISSRGDPNEVLAHALPRWLCSEKTRSQLNGSWKAVGDLAQKYFDHPETDIIEDQED